MAALQNAGVVMIDPALIATGSNVRYSLIPDRVKALADNILEAGGVRENLEVFKLKTPDEEGHQYGLETGNYRLAAAMLLNKKDAGVLVPCKIVEQKSPAERIISQVDENLMREDMSPMDRAVAIRDMKEAGVPMDVIRTKMASKGGRKGNEKKPASPAYIGMLLSFLEFPAKIQKLIHEGFLSTAGAYKLTRNPQEKWEEILTECEAERVRAIEKENAEEERYLKAQAKAQEAAKAEQDQKDAISKAEKELEEAVTGAEAAKVAATEAYTALQSAAKHERKKLAEVHKAKDTDSRGAVDKLDKAQKAYDKLMGKLPEVSQEAAKTEEKAKEIKKDLDSKSAKRKTAAIGPSAVEKAAAKVGSGQFVALKMKDMNDAIHTLSISVKYPKVMRIGAVLMQMASGELTPSKTVLELAAITGEAKK